MTTIDSFNILIEDHKQLAEKIKTERLRLQQIMSVQKINDVSLNNILVRWQNLQQAEKLVRERIITFENEVSSMIPRGLNEIDAAFHDDQLLILQTEKQEIISEILSGNKQSADVNTLLEKYRVNLIAQSLFTHQL